MVRKRSAGVASAVVALLAAGSAAAQGPAPDFAPHYTFQGSQLTGWTALGQADWRAENGEIVARPRGAGGGWLLLDRPLQDVAFHTRFRCGSPCRAGVLFRAERTPQGMSGILLSLADGDLAPYRVTLDASGRETSREPLGRATTVRVAPAPAPLPPRAPGANPPAPPSAQFPPPPGVTLPELQLPATGLRRNDWNTLDVILDANILRPNLNGTNEIALGYADPAGFGPIALYAGPGAEVRFRDLAYRDLNLRDVPPEAASSRFRVQRLDEHYRGWDAAAGDFNRDGVLDVFAGGYYYLGPDYTQRREVFLSTTTSPGMDYVMNMIAHSWDFNADGWPDVMSGSYSTRPMAIYLNPGTESRRWDRHVVLPGIASEVTLFENVVGDSTPEVLFVANQTITYATFTPTDSVPVFQLHPVSERGFSYGHGLGVGDVNGDGRKDVVQPAGWWEQPATLTGAPWRYHPYAFARWSRSQTAGGGNMAVWDVNRDGLNDVVASLNAHGWGLAWFEQKRDASGNITFERHMIMDDFSTANAGGVTFSELHAGAIPVDVDGDGSMDFVTGKRHWGHLDTYQDADPQGPAVVYWYRSVRNPNAPGGVEFVPELLHNRSGFGSLAKVVDLNRDGAPDILASGTRGAYIFWGTPRR